MLYHRQVQSWCFITCQTSVAKPSDWWLSGREFDPRLPYCQQTTFTFSCQPFLHERVKNSIWKHWNHGLHPWLTLLALIKLVEVKIKKKNCRTKRDIWFIAVSNVWMCFVILNIYCISLFMIRVYTGMNCWTGCVTARQASHLRLHLKHFLFNLQTYWLTFFDRGHVHWCNSFCHAVVH